MLVELFAVDPNMVYLRQLNAFCVTKKYIFLVEATGRFSNLPPGRYWAVARQAGDTDPHADGTLRALEEADTRLKLRRAAEADKNEVEFKPCQNVIDYQLPFKLLAIKN
jgi:hypothetical protein